MCNTVFTARRYCGLAHPLEAQLALLLVPTSVRSSVPSGLRARKSRPESCIKFKVPDILLVALFKAKSQGQGHAVHWRRTAAEDRDKF